MSDPETLVAPTSAIPLPQLALGWHVLTATALADGRLALVTADKDIGAAFAARSPDGRVLGKPFELAAAAQGQLWVLDGESALPGPLFALETPFPNVDRFPNGHWLVVASRTRGDPNARVLDESGRELRHFMLGDGIQHAQVDTLGRIWVGWFDEGIFGNDDWKLPGRKWPPSASGLACFDAGGKLLWEPDLSDDRTRIDDCYALNVIGEAAWSCSYTPFTLVRSQPGLPPRIWPATVTGADAVAISTRQALFAGGYGEEKGRLTLVNLTAGTATERWSRAIALPVSKRPLYRGARGDTIHVVDGGQWLRWSIAALN